MATYLFVSSLDPGAAERAVSATPLPPDLCVISPSAAAQAAAVVATGGRWIFTLEEPLLAARVRGESRADVVARYAQALRGIHAYVTRSALIVCDELDTLGGGPLGMDSDALMRTADDLDRALPAP
jgi:hypothetical protein